MSVSRLSRRPVPPRLLAAVLVFLAVQSTAVASLGTPLLPTVQRVERVSLAASQWTLTITLLAGAVATPLMGRLGDGRLRRLTTVGAVAVMLVGCVLSAIPAGFGVFLVGRVLQGAGLGLVPLATAVARDDLPADRSRPAIVLIGVTTAAGIGIGYPLVGLLAQGLGLYAPFWFAAGLSALALAAALVALPDSPARPARVDVTGAVLLGAGIAGLLLVLAQGPAWGWTSAATLGGAFASVALLAAWVGWEQRVRHPLIELRLLGRRTVLAANLTVFLIAVGFYPLMSLAVRFAQTPPAVGYGLGASVVVAAAMLTPFSLASFAASRLAARAARRTSAEIVVSASCVLLIVSMVLFLVARDSSPGPDRRYGPERLWRGQRLRGQPAADHRGRARVGNRQRDQLLPARADRRLRHRQRAERHRARPVHTRRAAVPRGRRVQHCGADQHRRPGRRAGRQRLVRHEKAGAG